ncbi:MAG TPA: FAD-dependent oxidoreductase [Pyrinomonadaceae bacterium]|nr:FAD-dependent oxidoreductase [Pyrinomonadaceae bacterium]
MDCEVAVVGGGIGGLTVAALLAQRGVDVCLLERDSQVGGCGASFEKFGYKFDPTDGLYTGWADGDIYPRIFSELSATPPQTRPLQPAYVVSLPDGEQVSVTGNLEQLESEISRAFPECRDLAIAFYRQLSRISSILDQVVQTDHKFLVGSIARKALSLARHGTGALELNKYSSDTTDKHLGAVSTRFRRFIDVQLQTLASGDSSQVSYLYAASVLVNRRGTFSIAGGAAALAESLAESISRNGGKIRLNTSVLRLSYDSAGKAIGVDLLTGETVHVSRAIISNLTIWDTYGKLIGLNRTAPQLRKTMNELRGWGAYMVYAGIDAVAAEAFSESPLLHVTDLQEGSGYDPETAQFVFNCASGWDPRAPEGKRAVTIHSFTDVERWFTFHRDETELEEMDQETLEKVWTRLHRSMPALGDRIEVIDTSTPRSYYEQTRRKLGMVGGLPVTPTVFSAGPSFETALPNVFIVSDTCSMGGTAGVSRLAQNLANHLLK